MKHHSLGVIGPGNHFNKKIKPIIKKNNFFKIEGFLRKKKIKKKIIFLKKYFLKRNLILFISHVQANFMKNI